MLQDSLILQVIQVFFAFKIIDAVSFFKDLAADFNVSSNKPAFAALFQRAVI
jgi:hypothetical protein